MRSLILVCLFGAFSTLASAQTLEVVSTHPSDGAFAVETDSIVITFNSKIQFDFSELQSDTSDGFFIISPEDSVQFLNARISDDTLSVIFDVELGMDTDFIAILSHAESLSGDYLEDPYLFQFTTASTRGEFVVEGTLSPEVMAKIHDDHYEYEDIVLVLAEEPLEMDFEEEECFEEECEEEGDDIIPFYAAFVDKETGDFSVSGVREGAYYPLGLAFFDEEDDFEEDEFYIPDYYFYDENGDFQPDSISVNSTTAPNDTLSGIQMTKFEIRTITFGEALEIAAPLIESLENDPLIAGGNTFYTNYVDFEEDEEEEEFLPKTFSLQSAITEDDEEEDFFDFFSSTDGTQLEWMIIGYDEVKDSVFSIYASPFGVEFYGYESTDITDVPDSIDFADIKGVPESFIDSDSAAYIIEMEGGAEFKETFGGPYDLWFMDLLIQHTFWEYPFDNTPDAPVTWQGIYLGYSYDEFTGEPIGFGYLVVIVDAETGDVLYEDSAIEYFGEFSYITFDEALAIADTVLNDFPNDPEILGGFTRYSSEYVGEDGFGAKMIPKTASKFNAILEDEQEFEADPNGYAFSWEIYAFDAVKDSALILGVTEFGTEFFGYFHEDSNEVPVDFSEIKPLPESHIDSDSAAYIIEKEGGGDYRASITETAMYWEMDLEILHDYWFYPLDSNPETAPVTWKGEYRAWLFDEVTFEVYEDTLTIYLDATTGEVLFNSTPVSSEEDIQVPSSFSLLQNYPNPFNPTTNIPFALNTTSRVEITVYSILGQKVATITDQVFNAGTHTITWDASNFSSGIYLYRMKSGDFIETRKLLLVK